MPRWTVQVGGAEILIETTSSGLVRIDTAGPVLADRRVVEELRTKLGAAIADERGDTP